MIRHELKTDQPLETLAVYKGVAHPVTASECALLDWNGCIEKSYPTELTFTDGFQYTKSNVSPGNPYGTTLSSSIGWYMADNANAIEAELKAKGFYL